MVGKTNVGKSKLIDRFINDKYSDTNEPTIGVDFFAKIL